MACPYATWPLARHVIARMDRVLPAQHRNETGELPRCPNLEERVRSLGDPGDHSRNATGNRHRDRLQVWLWLSYQRGSEATADRFPDNVQFIEGDSIASRYCCASSRPVRRPSD